MDWVHCNDCFVQPGDVEMKKFFITNCGHIYCDECLQMNQTNECKVCQMKFTSIPLSSNMNSDVEVYFHDPIINLKKQIKILEFQQSHRIRLVSYNRDGVRGYKTLKQDNFNLNEELNLFKEENLALRKENKKLKEDLIEIKKRSIQEITGVQREHGTGLQITPRLHGFTQFLAKQVQRKTPNHQNIYERLAEENFRSTPSHRRQPNSNFFIMSDSKSLLKGTKKFATPDLTKFPDIYRCKKACTPDKKTPPTPESILRELGQKDPLQRKIRLPTGRTGPSPSTKFHGLSLSRHTSTPQRETIQNKYLKYFK